MGQIIFIKNCKIFTLCFPFSPIQYEIWILTSKTIKVQFWKLYPFTPLQGGGIYPLKRYSYKKKYGVPKASPNFCKNFETQTLKTNTWSNIQNKINQLFLKIFNETIFYQISKKFCHTKFFFPFSRNVSFRL